MITVRSHIIWNGFFSHWFFIYTKGFCYQSSSYGWGLLVRFAQCQNPSSPCFMFTLWHKPGRYSSGLEFTSRKGGGKQKTTFLSSSCYQTGALNIFRRMYISTAVIVSPLAMFKCNEVNIWSRFSWLCKLTTFLFR